MTKHIGIVDKDSPYITALIAGTATRRDIVSQALLEKNASDDVIDNAELLTELVNTCFWTSTNVEEGRTVKGTVCVCSPIQVPQALTFDKPVPLSVKNLTTLLTASPQSSPAVHADKGRLVIWGLTSGSPIFSLKLRIATIGTIVASVTSDIIAVLERGEVHIPKSAGGIEWNMIVAKALDQTKTFTERMKLAAKIQHVVTAMHRQGHGGTLLLLPSSQTTWEKHVTFSFRFNESSTFAIQQHIIELEKAQELNKAIKTGDIATSSSLSPHSEIVVARQKFLAMLLQSVGDLSAIDGAVVIDEELKVIGFGAKLQVELEDFEFIAIDALSGVHETVSYANLGGTRHQSAARFVHQNHDAMAFVASQDGRLTLLAWVIDDGKVVAVRNLEHFVWEYPQN